MSSTAFSVGEQHARTTLPLEKATGPHLIIDDEFARLVPPLGDLERVQLESNLATEGCRDPLIVWAETQVLLDGHNRYAFCLAHEIAFTVAEVSLASRDEARRWIIDHQLGRRNVSQIVASYLRGKRYNLAKGRRGGGRQGSQRSVASSSVARAMAAEYRVDERTVKRDGKFAEAVDRLEESGIPKVRDLLLAGKIAYSRAAVFRFTGLPTETQCALGTAIAQGGVKSLSEAIRSHQSTNKVAQEKPLAKQASRYQQAMDSAADFRVIERQLDHTARLLQEIAAGPAGHYLASRTNELVDRVEQIKQVVLGHVPARPCGACQGTGCQECGRAGFFPSDRLRENVI